MHCSQSSYREKWSRIPQPGSAVLARTGDNLRDVPMCALLGSSKRMKCQPYILQQRKLPLSHRIVCKIHEWITDGYTSNSVLHIWCTPLWSSVQSSWLCVLWGTNWIYICYVEESIPPLWSSGQSSWLQILRSGFDSRRYQIFSEVVGLEWGPLSLVSTTEELLGRNSCGSSLENGDYGSRDPSHWPRGTFYPQKLALTPLTRRGSRSV
jgi:hypothetical protein